jgi:enediyne polyketide synthase
LQTAAVLTNYNFDRLNYRISKSTFDQTDLTHWLTLDVVSGALKDAGFENGQGLNKDKVGVIIGNSLTGEFSRANMLRLRWPYVHKTLLQSLKSLHYSETDIKKIIENAEQEFKKPFPIPDSDTLAGGLSNTIAGRICNYYDFHGGGYTIDGACSSSLLAVVNACSSILNDELEIAIVGGVDLSIDPFELIGFSRNEALAKNEMEVFSKKPEGFWPGEGCGIVILMKEEEAIKRGLNIYATICGWGISSDGKGGITRPKSETQLIALKRAYQKAGYEMNSVTYFEAHGTGTPTGDEVEISAILEGLKKSSHYTNPAYIGSVKQLIGHTKAASGIAGFIKTVLSLKNNVIPPFLKSKNGIHPLIENNNNYLALPEEAKLYEGKLPFRAGISSFGFGGINVHVTIEENQNNIKPKKLISRLKKINNNFYDFEIFPISLNSYELLIEKLNKLKDISNLISKSEFQDLSNSLISKHNKNSKYKVSIVSNKPEDLSKKINILLQNISIDKEIYFDINEGIFYSSCSKKFKNAFLFPGQGAPIQKEKGVMECLHQQNGKTNELFYNYKNVVVDTSESQPIIVERTIESIEILENFGIESEFGIGHSLGEITGLYWSNVLDKKAAIEVAKNRGSIMSIYGEKDGSMLAVKCSKENIESLLNQAEVNITGFNGNNSFVLGGKTDQIEIIEKLLFNKGIHSVKLKVSHAFHTPLMSTSAKIFNEYLSKVKFNGMKKKLISTVTGNLIDKIDYKQHLYEQIEKPVKFIQAVNEIKDDVLFFFEIGPGSTLAKSLSEEKIPVISLNYGENSTEGLFKILSAAFISGNSISFEELTENRFYQDFDYESWNLDALENPCEKHQLNDITLHSNPIEIMSEKEYIEKTEINELKTEKIEIVDNSEKNILTFIKKVISEKTDIPLNLILDSDRVMSQLHINSLAIAEILSLTTKSFNKSHIVFSSASILANADGSLEEISQLIFNGENAELTASKKKKFDLDSLPNWTHVFKRNNIQKELKLINNLKSKGIIYVEGKKDIAEKISIKLNSEKVKLENGAIFIYDSEKIKDHFENFIAFIKNEKYKNIEFITLIDVNKSSESGNLKPIFRSFQQEHQNIKMFCLDFEKEIAENFDLLSELLINEIENSTKYKEVFYNKEGKRFESECEAIFLSEREDMCLNSSDVLIATGGGKGITFEAVKEICLKTNCKVAIIGRSLPENDLQLSENLNSLALLSIEFCYYSLDVTNKKDVEKCVQKINSDLGNITAIIHGAGINRPNRIENLTKEDFDYTTSIKVEGLKHLLNGVSTEKIKLLIGFGSIIAESGMQGNADYAWANSQLSDVIDEFSIKYSNCRALTFEWSVWDETGMGVNLNSLSTLKEQGVYPISIQNGLKILTSLISDKNKPNGKYIISGRFGKIPTLIFTKKEPILGRFIDNIIHFIPNLEIISDVSINLKDDIYLNNHVFNDQHVFPTVMLLEGMSQISQYLFNEKIENFNFVNLKINKSIFIPKENSNIIRFIGIRISEKIIKLIVQSEDSNFEVNCVEAELEINAEHQTNEIDPIDFKKVNKTSLNIDIQQKFYDDLLFHEGPFRRVKDFFEATSEKSSSIAFSNTNDNWFSSFLSENKLLGDPGLNDAAIHSHQICRPNQRLLPIAAKKITIYTDLEDDEYFIYTNEIYEVENQTAINVIIKDKKGEIKQFWQELILTHVKGTSFNGEWDYRLLSSYLEYVIKHLNHNKIKPISKDSILKIYEELKNNQNSSSFEIEDLTVCLETENSIENSEENENLIYTDKNLKLKDLDHQYKLTIYKKIKEVNYAND